ncbi:MAG: hypothetical protein ACLRRB_01460 [Ruminococcus sp.]
MIADLMFEHATVDRMKYEQHCTPQQKAELEDEYFTTVEELTHIFSEEDLYAQIIRFLIFCGFLWLIYQKKTGNAGKTNALSDIYESSIGDFAKA